MKKFEAAYIKCIKMFFEYDHRHSVTMMLLDLRFYIMHHSSFVSEREFDHVNSVA